MPMKEIIQLAIRNVRYLFGLAIFIFAIYLFQFLDVGKPDKDILGNFIEWYGILFSILLALVIVHVWTKYNTVEALVDKEADALVSLLRFAKFLESPSVFTALADVIHDYCTYFCHPRLSYQNAMKDSRAKLDKIFSELFKAVKSVQQPILISEMIRCFDEAADTRGDRDALAKERIPSVLWFMMVFTSMIWLTSFFWLAFEDVHLGMAVFMLFSTSVTVIGLLFIAKDIDNPISGMWRISFNAFHEACNEIAHMRQQFFLASPPANQ